jgi:hypothetical protein
MSCRVAVPAAVLMATRAGPVALIEACVWVSLTPRMTVTTSRSARSVSAGLG